jgi:hypothetical protein
VERGGPLIGKVGEWCVQSRHLQGCIPHLCQLRTDGLAPVRKYWTYWSHADDIGPVSQVACCRQMFDFLHYFIGWLRRETGYGPMDRSAGVLWIVSGTLFLGSSDSVQLCRRLVKGCLVRGLPAGNVHPTYVDWHGKYTCRIGRVFPCRVYIDSNRRDTRIWVSLVCGSHHVDNLTNLMSLLVDDVVLLNIFNCLQLLLE